MVGWVAGKKRQFVQLADDRKDRFGCFPAEKSGQVSKYRFGFPLAARFVRYAVYFHEHLGFMEL